MKLKIVTGAGLLALAAISQSATASVIEIRTLAEGSAVSASFSDPQGPAAAGSLTSSGTLPCTPPDFACSADFSGDAFANAGQNVAGVGAVELSGAFASGDPALNSLLARSTYSETVTNNSGASQSYTYDFFITPITLTIADFAGISDTSVPTITVSYGVEISLDGGVVFTSGADLVGGRVSHTLTLNGTALGSTFFDTGSLFGYTFNSFADSLDLGSVAAGDSLTLDYAMFVELSAPGFETGGAARLGDPFDLANGGVGGVISASGPPGVPVPGTLALVMLALIGLGGSRAARHRRAVARG